MNGEPLVPWVCAPMLPMPSCSEMNIDPLLQHEVKCAEYCQADQECTEEQSVTLTRQELPAGMPALTVYLGRTCYSRVVTTVARKPNQPKLLSFAIG